MDDVVMNSSAGGASAGRGRGVGLRGLVLGWSLWLLGTWVVLWAVGGWTMPALRVMVLAGLVGMMGVWPALRLSQVTGPRHRRRALTRGPAGAEASAASGRVEDRGRGGSAGEVSAGAWARACRGIGWDWLALNGVFQAVLWPLQLAARWTVEQTAWLVVAVAAWSLLTGLIIAWGRGTNRAGWRSWAMVACVGMVVLEPLLWWMGWMSGGREVGPPEMRFSPLQAVWGVSTAGTEAQAQAAIATHGFQIMTVAAAAVVGWAVLWGLLLIAAWRERRGKSTLAG